MSAFVLGNYFLLTFVVCTVVYLLCYATIVNEVQKRNIYKFKSGDTGCLIAIPLLISAIGSRVGIWGAAVCYIVALLQYLEVL